MSAPRSALAAIAVTVVAAVVLAILAEGHIHAHDPSAAVVAADSSAQAAEAARALASEKANALPPIAALQLPKAGSTVLFFGDSYTEGYAAQPLTNGYAYVTGRDLGWNAVVDSGPGSGYVKPGPDGRTYVQRMTSLPDVSPDLIILQGGLNDQNMLNSQHGTKTLADELSAASQVIAALRGKYAGVQIVMLGPIQITTPAPSVELREVDTALRGAAAKAGLNYIDPIGERWNITGYLIADHTHPNTAGHQYIAKRLEADLKTLASR